MKKILIIGKKGFLGSNLTIYLSKHYNVDNFSFNTALKKKIYFFFTIFLYYKHNNSPKLCKKKISTSF